MTDNFFTDNQDLHVHFEQMDLSEIVDIKEDGYRYHDEHSAAPRNYRDAKDNYRLILESLGQICAARIAPTAAEADEEGAQCCDGCVSYPAPTQEALDVLRQADLMGAVLPWEYGGLNLPETIYQMMIEMVSRAEAGLMTIFGLQEISATIAEYGDDDLKARYLPRFASGEVTGAMVLTEPDAGSDLGAVQTRATYDEEAGVWRLNGVKRFITNGCADVLLVLARSEKGSRDARGLSMFVVEADDSVSVRRIENKLGLHSSPTCEIQFVDTPAELLGRRRFGLIRYAMAMMNGARLAVSSQALGIAEAAYREAFAYAEKRVQFGKAIRDIPAVYRLLLSMRGKIEAGRALVYETARWVDLNKAYQLLKDRDGLDTDQKQRMREAGRLADVLTPLVKYYCTEMANRVCYDAIQVHGGTGYMREFAVERHYRDVRVTSIYEGTSQLQIVAATGGILGHALDDLLDDWGGMEVPDSLTARKAEVAEATELLNRCIDHLKEQERPVLDYYASDLADVALGVINSWLLLRNANVSDRKREIARAIIAEMLTEVRSAADLILESDPSLLNVKDTVLAIPY